MESHWPLAFAVKYKPTETKTVYENHSIITADSTQTRVTNSALWLYDSEVWVWGVKFQPCVTSRALMLLRGCIHHVISRNYWGLTCLSKICSLKLNNILGEKMVWISLLYTDILFPYYFDLWGPIKYIRWICRGILCNSLCHVSQECQLPDHILFSFKLHSYLWVLWFRKGPVGCECCSALYPTLSLYSYWIDRWVGGCLWWMEG